MGIVVSLAMLLAIVFLSSDYFYRVHRSSIAVRLGLVFLVCAGSWNSIWYGLQNIQSFWGVAGFVSGIFILLSAAFVFKKGLTLAECCVSTQHLIRIVLLVGLVLCFALYSITIVRINLSLPIIR